MRLNQLNDNQLKIMNELMKSKDALQRILLLDSGKDEVNDEIIGIYSKVKDTLDMYLEFIDKL